MDYPRNEALDSISLNRSLRRHRNESDGGNSSSRMLDVDAPENSERTLVTSGESSDEASEIQRREASPASVRSTIASQSICSSGDSAAVNSSTPDDTESPAVPLHEQGCKNSDDEFELALMSLRNKRLVLSRMQEVVPYGRLSLINLSRRGLDADDAHIIKAAIIANPHLSVLKLSYNELGDSGCSIISSGFIQNGVHHGHLSLLDLGFNGLGDAGCEALSVSLLAGNSNMRTLFLSGNHIGEKGVLSIAGAILHGTGLRKLYISANQIGPEGIKTLASAVAESDSRIASDPVMYDPSQCGLTELDLGSCGIGGEGFITVPGMLLSNRLITSLCLSNNNLGDAELSLLAQAFTQNKKLPLRDLILSFNNITCRGVEDLMNAMWGSETLKQIKLDNNRIKDRGTQLCAVVLTSIPLEVIDLSCNPITTAGIKSLMKTVSECSSLVSLGLCGITMDQNGSKAISYALAYNSSLERIFMDRCEAGYSAQRHVVAGIVSNRRSSLRLFTGFPIGPIAATLGIPRLPVEWSNDQVLGFFRMMWHQWLLKSGRGTVDQNTRGPAPPAAVATAAKLAFASLGTDRRNLFQTETHEKPIAERPPVDPVNTCLMERTSSGTLRAPSFSNTNDDELNEGAEAGSKSAFAATAALSSQFHAVRGPLENPEKRNRYLHWLREHFRPLTEIGRHPFNNADLWKLHQHYFSPPTFLDDTSSSNLLSKPTKAINRAPPPTPSLQSSSSMGRSISFQSLGSALAASTEGNHKRRTHEEDDIGSQPATKRAKALKQRIAYYPRLMTKIESLSSRPIDETLPWLRQLKYTETVLFGGRDPYADPPPPDGSNDDLPTHADIEMILLDLL